MLTNPNILIPILLAAGGPFNPKSIAIGLITILFSLTFHESAHAYVADRCGDPTARLMGRITLNPIPHIDPFMTILVPILCLMTAGFAFGGAKPVPVNPYNLNHPRRDMMWVALAGPVSNLILAVLSAVAIYLVFGLAGLGVQVPLVIINFLSTMVFVNLLLAVFNMVPIPPLDGSRVASYFMSNETAKSYARLEQYGLFIIVGLFYLVPGFSNLIRGVVGVLEGILYLGIG